MTYGDKSLPIRTPFKKKLRINLHYFVTEAEYAKLRSSGKTIREICEIINFPSDEKVFYKYAKSQGWDTGNKILGTSKRLTVNEDFFKSWSRESAWVFGWLLTDGFIDEARGHIKLGLKSIDEDVLYKIKTALNFSGDVARSRRPDGREASRLVICRKSMTEDLFYLGMARKDKTFNTRLPDVPEDVIGDLFRGIFEGDGNITRGTKWNDLRITIAGATKQFMLDMQTALEQRNIFTTIYTRPPGKSGNIHEMYTLVTKSNADALRWCFLMYRNTDSSIRLNRKFEVFRNYVEGYYDRKRYSQQCIDLVEMIRKSIPECNVATSTPLNLPREA